MRIEGLIEYSVIDRNDLDKSTDDLIKKYFKNNTKLLAFTLASNLTGRIVYRRDLFSAASKMGIKCFVDSSQGAGKIRLDMVNDSIDYLAFTGHKDLRGLPGVGGLCSLEELSIKPLIQGGTGVLGHEKVNPSVYPEAYEAGTLNMPAIWALKEAVNYTEINHEVSVQKEEELTKYLLDKLSEIEKLTIYDKDCERVSTIGFNVKGYSSNEIVQRLDRAGICTRGGIHCAILAHEALETTDIGIVRVSLSDVNTIEEIDVLINTLKEIGEE